MILFEFFMSKCEILKEKIERKAGEELKVIICSSNHKRQDARNLLAMNKRASKYSS